MPPLRAPSNQDELTQEIISALRVKLTPEQKDRLARKNKIDEEAYDLFLRAREYRWHATRTGSIEARNLLGRAITINPDFAAAHASIGATYVANGWAEIPEQSLQTALQIAERAVQLDEEEPSTMFLRWPWVFIASSTGLSPRRGAASHWHLTQPPGMRRSLVF